VSDHEQPRFETLTVHAGFGADPETGAVVPGIEPAATFAQDAVGAPRDGYEYARTDNPTRRILERAIAELEGGAAPGGGAAAHGVAFASGMAATQALFYALAPGERLLLGDDVYGGTWRLADKVMARYGVGVDVVDTSDLEAVESALTPQTKMVWLESPTNPLLKVVDIGALAALAAAAGAQTVVDNTFATPYLQRPLELGADVVLHSATKYLGGHSDVVSGLVVTRSAEVAERLHFHQNAAGAVPSPFDCWLVLRGLRTLAVRLDRACANAARVAEWLTTRPEVSAVHYPGLPDHPQRALAERQMRLPGAMLSFQLGGDAARAARVAGATRVFTLAESLGAVESLIEVPAVMTHASVAGSSLEVPADLVRLSIGIEAADDLIGDLEQALASA
jgi:cystathionine beta-lyase/cystathionine gamma-synthase